MKYDFDEIIERKNTNCVKYDFLKENGYPDGTIPMWVADMDFTAPREVTQRLRDIASHGIYGYSESKNDYFETLRNWFSKRHSFEINPEWTVKTAGVIAGVAAAVRAYTEPGDGVIIQSPVYGAFKNIIESNSRKLVDVPLINEKGNYCIDFDRFEKTVVKEKCRLFILCSPHNPVGRVWTKYELHRLGDICLTHGVIVISDEIHCDFTYPEHTHTVFASIDPLLARNSVICTAPSKTFNLAGLNTANIFVPDQRLRDRLEKEVNASGAGGHNLFGMTACKAAYEYGDKWLDQLREYLLQNINITAAFLAENLPQCRMMRPEGTYLIWLDFNGLNMSDTELNDLLKQKARVWLSWGGMFGPGGKGFQRMNIACPAALLRVALNRIKQALNG